LLEKPHSLIKSLQLDHKSPTKFLIILPLQQLPNSIAKTSQQPCENSLRAAWQQPRKHSLRGSMGSEEIFQFWRTSLEFFERLWMQGGKVGK